MGLSSAGSRGLLWAPVEVLVRISAERGRSNWEILCRVLRQDGLTIGIGVVVQRAIAAPWWYAVLDRSAGGPAGAGTGLVGGSRMVKTGRLLWRIVRV